MPSMQDYRKAFRGNPGAFIAGARAFCKEAERRIVLDDGDGGSLWDSVMPWVLGLGGAAAAYGLGSAWGRHAERTGSQDNPYTGPVREFLLRASHPGKHLVWDSSRLGRALARIRGGE